MKISKRLPGVLVAAQLFQVVSPHVRGGARFMYGFFSTAVTYPLMFAISVAMTPWGEIVTAVHWVNIVMAVSTVLALTVTGFFVGRLVDWWRADGDDGAGRICVLEMNGSA